MDMQPAPQLAGIHHLKLPVTDLARSREWYQTRLGYRVQIEFAEQGQLMGYALAHPNGGPPLGLRLDPERARAAAGFDYFAIGVPGKEAIEELAARLTALGEQHARVHWASIGWILPHLHDPDGHEIRFYTLQHHTELDPDAVTAINDPRESAERHEQAATRPAQETRCMMPPTEPAPTRAARNPITADDPKVVRARSLHITADRDLRYPVQWTGQQAVVTLPQHIGITNADQIREQLLWIINRGAAVLTADLTGTVSCDYSGADALARAQHRATANGTDLRLVVTADAVRRVLTLNGFDRLVAIYPDLDAAAAGTGRHEQRTRTAADPARTEEVLDGTVAGLFAVGLILQGAIDLPPDVTAQRISEALRRLDDIVREIRNHVFAGRGQSRTGTVSADTRLQRRRAGP